MATVLKTLRSRRSRAKVDHYFASYSRGQLLSIRGELLDRLMTEGDRIKTKRYRFEPLDSPARFDVAVAEWEPPRERALPKNFRKLSDEQRDAYLREEAIAARERAIDPPTSLVAFPPKKDFYSEMAEGPLLTRAESLTEVARLNRKQFESGNFEEEWYVAVEVGVRPASGLVTISMSYNGMGGASVYGDRPVRLVMPTAAELAKYAVGKVVQA
jgi:hypothetical protein